MGVYGHHPYINLHINLQGNIRDRLLGGVAVICIATGTGTAAAQAGAEQRFDIPAQSMDRALRDFAVQSGISIMADAALADGKRSQGLSATADPEAALRAVLAGSGLGFARDGDTIVITAAANASQTGAATQGAATVEPATASDDAQSGAAAPERDRRSQSNAIDRIVVTAQKKEEGIQDVPIAVSAFSEDTLDDLKIERGEELLRAIPNVTFSKTNFSSFNFSIRGIGTKAISSSTDPAVAVSFNNTALLRNRLFEQEFFDLERVEVLRGPQGTLYGRNATGGVVNILPALPGEDFGAELELEVGNFQTRRASGHVNLPVTDAFALRFAGAWTQRDGFDFNAFTGNNVNGRDLYSTRVTAQWEPTDRLRADFMWQRFKEDSDRSRTGKQLCTRDPGPETIGDAAVPDVLRGRLSQGCLPGSLYDDAAFGTPNGASFAFVTAGSFVSLGGAELVGSPGNLFPSNPPVLGVEFGVDPYEGVVQSRDLREIATSFDPVFRTRNDLFQFNVAFDLTDSLTFFSQTTYADDSYYSSQDYSRYVSNPVFNDSLGLWYGIFDILFQSEPGPTQGPTPGGVYTDPQLGPSNRILSVDISQSNSEQWSQEFRLQSSFDGPLNFSLGANYLNFESTDDYYVFNNLFTFVTEYFYNNQGLQFDEDFNVIPESLVSTPRDCSGQPENEFIECIYVDPNTLDQVDDEGHNYFLSRNPIKTESWALFGEAYWNVTPDVKLTGGLRYTSDEKTAGQIPTQLLLGAQANGEPGPATGGRVIRGLPPAEDIRQSWEEFTGRFVVDWNTQTPFTDETLFYASYSRGYKGGGANPPRVDIDPDVVQFQPLATTFEPEFVNAFEIGAKNSLLDGSLIINATGFYYDYTDYQVSQIVDRISFNENFDAEVWGLEFESSWRATRNLRFDATLGFLQTRIADGEQSIDVMNRTQGNEDWVLVRPWLQVPSNCIAPRDIVEQVVSSPFSNTPGAAFIPVYGLATLCAGSARLGGYSDAVEVQNPLFRWDQTFGTRQYNPLTDAPNGGRGFFADLGGNELPNSPNLTFNIGAEYLIELGESWELRLRGDYYRQSESYARVYNTEYDRLEAWDNLNAAATLTHPDWRLALQFYVKNVFDDAPITDVFTNSDDTGLTANVFTLEPRIFGFSVNKQF